MQVDVSCCDFCCAKLLFSTAKQMFNFHIRPQRQQAVWVLEGSIPMRLRLMSSYLPFVPFWNDDVSLGRVALHVTPSFFNFLPHFLDDSKIFHWWLQMSLFQFLINLVVSLSSQVLHTKLSLGARLSFVLATPASLLIFLLFSGVTMDGNRRSEFIQIRCYKTVISTEVVWVRDGEVYN